MAERVAIIDLGTNTFHLLIAEMRNTAFTILHRERIAVKIGKGGINQDIIQEAAIQRALDALRNFKTTMDQLNTSRIYAFGTSALRNARNANDVVEAIQQATGIAVSIISGNEEASLIYQGVRSGLDLGKETSLIIDIGGGSVEFIIGNEREIVWKKSMEIGAQRLLEKFQGHDPIAPDEITQVKEYLDQALGELKAALKTYRPDSMVGSSGTFDTLSDIHCIENYIDKGDYDPETPLTMESFYSIYEKLISKNRAERMLIPGMIEMRVDMIVVACVLIHYLLEHHPFSRIRVSSYALKEGILASLNLKF